ncbi:LacI family DNA-binding transcriptional regulator [Arsenicitalea aurantiaca]|uniref:LacI family DNA-binding transcriptional regulator n=1 Tax=Arsenicitalea aurantiaca TaxID=1783274 RepID=A0A433X481_9HYPH|nr:LacI family DNA-binding transcriptional regulator [Arsenicitalea aurantiaca]RUT28876.1 LacI family DNA-binding transcriptional regulator [Arsenicitalea aurantiaca]
MKKRVKMVDIARAAKVSQTTVSLVLNHVPNIRIADETRQRVLSVARELGYTPGPSLYDLDPARKRLFGVMINEISSAYPINLIDGLNTWADTQGAQLLVQITGGLPDHDEAALENFARFGIDTIVYARTFTAIVDVPPRLDAFRHVLLNCRRPDSRGLAVLPAERYGGALATDHLVAAGCRRIATITGDPWQLATAERLAGYHRALGRAGLARDAGLERRGDWSHASGFAQTLALMALPEPPDGIFCQNDIMARGALAALASLGMDVPGAVRVIGYDDRDFARDLDPALSTVTLPHVEMAERAMDQLAGEAQPGDRTTTIQGKLVVRKSTMPDA